MAQLNECSRYKINRRLAQGPANATDVVDYLKEALDRHGAPLVLKHDGGSIFHYEKVKKLLEKYDVVDLTSPPFYPRFNGKKERSLRDIKGYERALRKHQKGASLFERIDITLRDLNEDRPRPVLGGRTTREVFEETFQDGGGDKTSRAGGQSGFQHGGSGRSTKSRNRGIIALQTTQLAR